MAGEPPRILLVAGRATGGLRVHVTALARHLARRGWPVTVAASPVTLETLRAAGDDRIRLVSAAIGAPAPWRLPGVYRCLRTMAAGHDVVHAHGLRASAAAVLASRSRPVISTWHNAAVAERGVVAAWHAALERLVARRSRLVLAVSPDLAERATRAGAEGVRLIEVPAPADRMPTPADPAALRSALGVTGERPLVLTVARLERQKGLDDLIAAAAGWRGERDPVVVVAGDGPLRRALQRRIDELGAPVRLLGQRRDVPDLLAAAEVFALPSRWEGWPLAMAEALRAGVPAVVSDLPGPRRLAGEAAVYVPAGRPTQLRAGIELALADSALRARLVAAGTRRAAEWLALDAANDELLADYLDLNMS